jgi:hypothetical protein
VSDECGVSFCDDYDGDNAFYYERWRKARKRHTCCECRETIQPGMRYLYVTGKSDDVVWTTKICEPCKEILREFNDGAWEFGKLWENFEQEWLNGAPLQPCLNRLETVASKKKLRDMWMQYKEIEP